MTARVAGELRARMGLAGLTHLAYVPRLGASLRFASALAAPAHNLQIAVMTVLHPDEGKASANCRASRAKSGDAPAWVDR